MTLWIKSSFPLLTVCLGLLFYKFQNRNNTIGGNISYAKAFWLSQCITVWMIYPLIIIITDVGSTDFKILLTLHLMSWYLRAPLELAMLYIWFNWKPQYGIAHDIFHLLLLVLLWYFLPLGNFEENIFFILLLMGTIFETFFAYYFLKLRGAKQSRIYFASDSDKWKKNNTITWVANSITLSLLTYFSFMSNLTQQ